MNYNVSDKAGWTMAEGRIAEGRIQRNRKEAARVVERIERNLRIERLVRAADKGPCTGSAAHLLADCPPSVMGAVDFLHQRRRALRAPMATHRNPVVTAIAVGAVWLLAIGAALWLSA